MALLVKYQVVNTSEKIVYLNDYGYSMRQSIISNSSSIN